MAYLTFSLAEVIYYGGNQTRRLRNQVACAWDGLRGVHIVANRIMAPVFPISDVIERLPRVVISAGFNAIGNVFPRNIDSQN